MPPLNRPGTFRRVYLISLAVVAISACSPREAASLGEAERLGPELAFPVDCIMGQTCEIQNYVDRDPGPGAQDYFCASRSYHDHNGTDIRIPDMAAQRAGVSVLAAAPGRVSRLRDGVADVSVRTTGIAAVDGVECGNGVVVDHGEGWETQYCHLAQGSLQVTEGDTVELGQVLGRIGLSGQTEYPHLHFTVRKDGTVVDPFAPHADARVCEARGALWSQAAADKMVYRRGAVLNTGFSSGAVSMEAVEEAAIPAPSASAAALVAYVRAIGLEAGDVQFLKVTGPDGAVVAETRIDPLDAPKAQYLLYAGRRTPAQGWTRGVYRAEYWVERGGRRALEQVFQISF
ncbi:MAG: M23 family metallopeptidase [Phenylobacterium sp.]|uniref:M23 family metallopeptidase n=1 Tax=Phenylobacterium sp. TaxID=1871053 RepID=UPI00271DB0B3|nr:M23 family metallopeptidase [Phenylobacterium sp.]MDO8900629.1 M23 family metallopeptidase [Phenylobacterium sp.]